MKLYRVTFKRSKTARHAMTWEQFAHDMADAMRRAKESLRREYFGEAMLLGVERADD